MNILGEFEDDLLLFGGGIALGVQVKVKLVDLGLLLGELLSELVHPLHLPLKNDLQVQQLILEILNPLLLRFQARPHLSGSVSQHMLALLQILYLELVLVEVGLSLFELLCDLKLLLFEHLDLLVALLELSLGLFLGAAGFLRSDLSLLAGTLELLFLSFYLLLLL